MVQTVKYYWNNKPLVVILFLGFFFRLLAVIFSKGYGMHDDHFLVIEAAQSWVDGYDYNGWIPGISSYVTSPSGHSLLYPGLHYFFFKFLQSIGIYDPQIKMYLVRFVHALYSLITVYYGYKIVLHHSSEKAAKTTGLLLALLWFIPNLSVRNLVESVCIPPLIFATWSIIKTENNYKWKPLLIAGIMLGIALSIRFQVSTFIAGIGLAMLVQKKWKELGVIILGFILSLSVIQMSTDIIIWKRPFAEIQEYIRYNMEHANEYIVAKWYNYLLLVGGILIPPISLFLMFGFVRSWKKYLILFLPAFVFFAFHSYLPSKQERFILPSIPFIIILGTIGWNEFLETSKFWKRNPVLLKNCWKFFWIMNFLPLLVVSTAYSKKSRIESMNYISKKKDVNAILIEESIHESYTEPPLFYLQKWGHVFFLTQSHPIDSVAFEFINLSSKAYPNYVVFNQPEHIQERVQNFKRIFPHISYEATIEPSFLDNVLHQLNKHNANFTSYIYKIDDFQFGSLSDSLKKNNLLNNSSFIKK